MRKSLRARRPPLPCSATGDLFAGCRYDHCFIVRQHRAVLKQRERTISSNGGWFLHLREEANPCRLCDPFMVRATISHDLMQ
jgi:hypothetical protein